MLLPTGVPTKRPDIITLKAALIFSADIKKKMRLKKSAGTVLAVA